MFSDYAEFDDVAAWIEFIKRKIAQMFNDIGALEPIAIIVPTVHPDTGERMDVPAMFIVPYEGEVTEMGKSGFAELVRALFKDVKAVAVAFAGEAWAVERELKNGDAEEQNKMVNELTGRVADHPEKIEVVILTVEHRLMAPKCYMSNILRSEERAVVAGWSDKSDLLTHSGGRFANFLEQNHALA